MTENLRKQASTTENRDIINECLEEIDLIAFKSVCANPNLTEEDIRNIYNRWKNTEDNLVLGRIALNLATPADIFKELLEHKSSKVLRSIAGEARLNDEQARELMTHESTDVRKALASNPNLSSNILDEYAESIITKYGKDTCNRSATCILSRIVSNQSIKMETFRYICHMCPSVVDDALRNNSADKESLEFIYSNFSSNEYKRDLLLEHKNCPAWILEEAFELETDFKEKQFILRYIKEHKYIELYRRCAFDLIEEECRMMVREKEKTEEI